jgi:hypothetical protein
MEYSTVSPNWKGRSRLWKEKTATDAGENCNTASAFPVSCQLHGMKDMLVLRIQLRSDNMSMEKDIYRVRVQRDGIFNLFLVHEVMRW